MTVARLPRSLLCVLLSSFLILAVLEPRALAQIPGSPQTNQPDAAGRVIATITTLEGTVHMSGRPGRAAHGVRRDRSREDHDRWSRARHIPRRASRPLHPQSHATRLLSKDSAPFHVRADDVAAGVGRHSVDLRDAGDRSPRRDALADRQRPAGVDERHARRSRCSSWRLSKATTSRACCCSCRASCAAPMAACASKAASPRRVRCRSAAPA